MKTVLLILTRPQDEFAERMLQEQAQFKDVKVERVDLTGGPADYESLVQKIFAADSVQVW